MTLPLLQNERQNEACIITGSKVKKKQKARIRVCTQKAKL